MKDLPRSIHWVTTSSLSFFPTLSSPFLEKLPKTSFSSFLSNLIHQIHQYNLLSYYFKSILHFISFYYTKLLRKTRIKNGTRKISHVLFSYPFWYWRKSCSKSVHVRTILLEKERGKKGEKDRRYIDGRRNTIGCYRNESRGASFAEGEGVLRNISNDPWAIRERNSSARPRRPSVWLYTYTLANGHGTTVGRIISKDLKVWPESTRTKGVLHEAGNVGSGVCVCGQRETLRWTFDSKTFRSSIRSTIFILLRDEIF